jgi:hypothetical protein
VCSPAADPSRFPSILARAERRQDLVRAELEALSGTRWPKLWTAHGPAHAPAGSLRLPRWRECELRERSARRSGSREKEAGNTLIATSRPRRGSRARYISPIPPDPRAATISFWPKRVPVMAATPAGSSSRGKARGRSSSPFLTPDLGRREVRQRFQLAGF